MIEFRDLMALAVNRKGGVKQVEAQLPAVKTPAQLRKPDDAFYFSAMTRRIFRAGLTHALVDARWPAFEEAFFGFDPEKLVLMPDTMLEDRMQDTRLIRHWGKMKAIRHNARLVLDLREEYGSVGNWLADWPAEDTVGIWMLLKKRGRQLGGNSGAAFLRMVGRDTWYPTGDVVAALKSHNIIDKAPSSQRDQRAAQAAFNAWQAESGRPQAHISKILAFTVG
ncbi:DNA-3-methyladenine glycosylase I [Alloalcanivorax gelatiniphagus]|uniref:DNA-3-methyladenine glycosylase I n=1 Tax=Alloalcanivorax gelatiniphagus TaxID=1194167 RepID=A0ABY2XNJ1_9GAMM|nr:DNA-3-methyladenine glycosylase I [Alloalcanivorax gelatiniphagus]TMW13373.1 DNA-3-methyladenine glycosylase I [Alloalcanivorax gelatiniphagus]